MLAVNVGICHQHNLVVPDLFRVKIFTDSGTESGDHRLNLNVIQRAIKSCLLNIQNLATKWQNRLRLGVSSGLR